MKNYVDRHFINYDQSVSTGSVAAFDGLRSQDSGVHVTWLEIADCHRKIRIKKATHENMLMYIDKLEVLTNELIRFNVHLTHNIIENKSGWYNRRTWLCPRDSASTDYIVTFDGYNPKFAPYKRRIFFEATDYTSKIRFHRTNDDTIESTIEKHELIISIINKFITYLKTKYK